MSPQSKLLSDIRAALHAGLEDAKAAPRQKMVEGYLRTQAGIICRLTDGYLVLRNANNIPAARTIIRPALEAGFKVQAVGKRPSFLYNIAQGEHAGDVKFVKIAIEKGEYKPESNGVMHPGWEQAKAIFRSQFPANELTEHAASAHDCATVAGLTALYDFQYRWFCNASHSALRAASDDEYMPHLGKLDDLTMARCALIALAALGWLGVSVPAFQQLADQYKILEEQTAQPSPEN